MALPYSSKFSWFKNFLKMLKKVNFRDKIFVITQRFLDFKTMCSSTQIASKREMLHVGNTVLY